MFSLLYSKMKRMLRLPKLMLRLSSKGSRESLKKKETDRSGLLLELKRKRDRSSRDGKSERILTGSCFLSSI